jgi:hypothetical protein
LTNTDTWWQPKRQDKMSIPWHLRFFLSTRGFLVRGVYLFSSPSPYILSKRKDKSNIHSGNNNLLRGART